MCEAFNLNHKVLTVEHVHRLINKRATITTGEYGINNIFVFTGLATDYDCNSAPIYSTNILHSTPVIDRELHFPIGTSLNNLLKLTQDNGQAVLDYLKITDSSCHFSSSIKKYY